MHRINPRTSTIPFSSFQVLSKSFVFGINSLNQEVFAQVDENEPDDYEEEDDEYLAEILAEEEREAEELAKMEAEMKELNEMKAQRQKMNQQKHTKMPSGGGMPGSKNKNFEKLEEELRRKETIAQEAKQESNAQAQEEIEKKKAEEIAKKREAAFEAEIARAKDERTRKNLERQKAKDAKIVKQILKEGMKGHHYAVLGLRCQWGEVKIGPFKFCSVKDREVKKAYRNMARLVHPDKNRDGRAEQAFDMLEKSSSILLDDKKRKEYDTKLKLQRKNSFQKGLRIIDDTWNGLSKTFATMKAILGPFATPIFILVALII